MVLDENVRLKNISIENWKCFSFKTFDFNEKTNFYNQINGFGKSSLIQAIVFCIYGKLPSGSKIKELQRDTNSKIKFSLVFYHMNSKYNVEREIYPNGNKVCRFKKNDEEFKEYSVNQMNAIMSEFFGDSKFIDIIWSQCPLIYSGILKTSFVSSLISDCLQEQKEFSDALKVQNLQLSKEKKKIEQTLAGFNGTEEDVDEFLVKAEKKKEELTKKLKNKAKSSVDDSKKSSAEKCLAAKNRRTELEKEFKELYTQDQISEFKKLKANKARNEEIIKNYSEALNEEINKYKKMFSNSELNKLLRINEDSHKCPVCNRKFSFKFTSDDLKHFEGKDDYDRAVTELQELREFNDMLIEKSEEYISLERDSILFEDPAKIIEEFNNQLEKEWAELDKVTDSIQKCVKCKEFFTSLKDIDHEMKAIQKLLEISKRYESEAIDFYTKTVVFRAMNMLSTVDEKYIGLYYDKIGSTYNVCVADDSSIRTRAVDGFSSGERTVVALCLALAFKEVFAPHSILILDESLGSLDPDHLETCMTLLSKVEYQTIVVAHNRK